MYIYCLVLRSINNVRVVCSGTIFQIVPEQIANLFYNHIVLTAKNLIFALLTEKNPE